MVVNNASVDQWVWILCEAIAHIAQAWNIQNPLRYFPLGLSTEREHWWDLELATDERLTGDTKWVEIWETCKEAKMLHMCTQVIYLFITLQTNIQSV